MNRNFMTVIGSPSLVTGALTADTNQALSFSGPTSSATADDSASLSITGSLSIELFVKLPAYPGTTQPVVSKASAYDVYIGTTGLVTFALWNGAVNGSVTTNTALALNRWYHITCVYNANYAGAQRFGKSTIGATTAQVDDGDGNNSAVTRATLLEQGILTSASVNLQYVDEIWPVEMSAVVYADSAGVPGALVTKSGVQTLSPPSPAWRSPTWVTFPLTPIVVPAGTYHIGYVADTVFGGGTKNVLAVGVDATGGLTSYHGSGSPSGPNDPFGPATISNANVLAAYCDYKATSRSGLEGKALVYIDGAINVSTVYGGGIADTSNALQVCPAMAAQVDELSIWSKALSPVQIAQHYTAH